jgi:hypothetical protein
LFLWIIRSQPAVATSKEFDMRNWNPAYFTMAIGVGIAIGVATHQLAVWTAIGAGLGMVFARSRPRRC